MPQIPPLGLKHGVAIKHTPLAPSCAYEGEILFCSSLELLLMNTILLLK